MAKASSVDIKKSNEIRENFKKEDYKTALEIAEIILKKPYRFRNTSIISECYYRLQDSNNLNYYSTQFRKLIDAVLSSGDGNRKNSLSCQFCYRLIYSFGYPSKKGI
jgi:hypothetical protein